MARVEGPLFSLQAHGKLARTIVYTRSRGLNVVRELVTPTNPRTTGQANERTVLVAVGRMLSRINANQLGRVTSNTMTPLEYLKSIRVAPRVWNSELVKRGYLDGWTTLDADRTAWAALTPEQQTAWNTFNTAFANSFESTPGAPMSSITLAPGEMAFTFARAMARAGYYSPVPDTAPPAWTNTLRTAAEEADAKKRLGAALRKQEDAQKK